MATIKTSKKQEEPQPQYILSRLVLTVQTPLVAPYLSNVKIIKKKQILDIVDCYRKLYPEMTEDDIEVLYHLDRGFQRDAECKPFISTRAVTSALRYVLNNPNIDVLGIIYFPAENVYVTTASVNVYSNKSTMTYEYVKPGTVTSALVKVKGIDIPFETTVNLGASKNKGYGVVHLKFEKVM